MMVKSECFRHSKSVPFFIMTEQLRRLCNYLRVKNGLDFKWYASSEEGMCIKTSNEIDDTYLEIIKKAASFYEFTTGRWVVRDGEFQIDLNRK